MRFLKQHHKAAYEELLANGTLSDYLVGMNEQAERMFFQLVIELAEKEHTTEALKAENQMLWV